MKNYQTPEIEFVLLSDEDIIATSQGLETSIYELEESDWIFT